jgi:hypothetical protein
LTLRTPFVFFFFFFFPRLCVHVQGKGQHSRQLRVALVHRYRPCAAGAREKEKIKKEMRPPVATVAVQYAAV